MAIYAEFPIQREYDAEHKKHIQFQKLTCGECGAFEKLPIKPGESQKHPDYILKVAAQRGWETGKRRSADLCPACVKEKAAARRIKGAKSLSKECTALSSVVKLQTPSITPLNMSITLEKEKPAMKNETPAANLSRIALAASTTAGPRSPSRDDKRLIMLELQEVYIGEDKGYEPGHSDETVAKKLNVPRKWVEDIREEFFGPAVDPELGKINGEIAALTVRLDAHERETRAIREALNTLKERASKVGKAA
jgi:hypothetical protein